jgi:AraC-like DNA-binding protein
VTDGELEVWINDHRKLLRKGEIAVAWSYDAHAQRTPSHSLSICMIIPPRFYSEFMPLLNSRHASETFLSDPELFEQIHSWVCTTKECDNEMIRKGYIYIILGTILKNISFEKDTHPIDTQLPSEALIYLNEHFREDMSLSSAAHALGYHSNYLSNIFKSALRIGFNQYLTLLRLREAVLLMQKGNKSITECAFESGFQSLRTFYRSFQAEFGCTPRDFISQNLQ